MSTPGEGRASSVVASQPPPALVDSRFRPPRLYAIADGETLGLDRLEAAVETMAEAGIRWIQLRLKRADDRQRYELTAACVRRLEGSETALWIDDRADLAAVLPLAGLHVGQRDLPPEAARRVIGERLLLGLSCHDLEQVRRADEDPAVDVVAIGPIFTTTSKQNPAPCLGLAGVAAARQATAKPLVSIGGIDAETAADVLAAGADSVAMIGALCRDDVGFNCRRLVALLEEKA